MTCLLHRRRTTGHVRVKYEFRFSIHAGRAEEPVVSFRAPSPVTHYREAPALPRRTHPRVNEAGASGYCGPQGGPWDQVMRLFSQIGPLEAAPKWTNLVHFDFGSRKNFGRSTSPEAVSIPGLIAHGVVVSDT